MLYFVPTVSARALRSEPAPGFSAVSLPPGTYVRLFRILRPLSYFALSGSGYPGPARLKLLKVKTPVRVVQMTSPPFGARDLNILHFIAASWLQSL